MDIIIIDKDNDQVLTHIFQSRRRSIHASQVFPLKSCNNSTFSTSKEYLPQIYELNEGKDSKEKFLPAASTEEDDYSLYHYIPSTQYLLKVYLERAHLTESVFLLSCVQKNMIS